MTCAKRTQIIGPTHDLLQQHRRGSLRFAPRVQNVALKAPKALDLFCGAGGVSMGLHRAGFDVVGIDLHPQPQYPFTFIQADALAPPVRLSDFDLICASPPCQAHSKTRAIHGRDHPDLIPQTRALLADCGVPYCIENVPGAKLDGFYLCGTMFGLKVIRHRHFEASFPILTPSCGKHGSTNSHRGYSTGAEFVTVAGNNYRRVEGAVAMGITWPMPRDRLSQAIPPAYSEFIGREFLRQQSLGAVGPSAGCVASQILKPSPPDGDV